MGKLSDKTSYKQKINISNILMVTTHQRNVDQKHNEIPFSS